MDTKQMAQNRLESLKENYVISPEMEKTLALGLENLINFDEQFYKAKAAGTIEPHLEQQRNLAVELVSKMLLHCSPKIKIKSEEFSLIESEK